MQKQLDEIKEIIAKRVQDSFEKDFEGSIRAFAKKAGCDEKTIRQLFSGDQGMTINLLFKISKAINVTPSKLLEDLELKSEK
ncbi:helix-turn-helix transcriptional regulator [Flavobacterium sp.]|uniref:helix-turn-helix domain-containing protein n=1 Tax=Flavobacterium sp. TaxID=239 RepID=UPI00260BA106|nr:helix-turn-helix transcriptional regulator [Flavobacterium sp.]